MAQNAWRAVDRARLATAILELDGRPMPTLPFSAKGIPLVETT